MTNKIQIQTYQIIVEAVMKKDTYYYSQIKRHDKTCMIKTKELVDGD
jgi:hypothetical protein